jgi:hypothetical protein
MVPKSFWATSTTAQMVPKKNGTHKPTNIAIVFKSIFDELVNSQFLNYIVIPGKRHRDLRLAKAEIQAIIWFLDTGSNPA